MSAAATPSSPAAGPGPEAVKGSSLWQDAMRRMRKNTAAKISLVVLVVVRSVGAAFASR